MKKSKIWEQLIEIEKEDGDEEKVKKKLTELGYF